MQCRDVSTGATGATGVAPKFSDTLTLFQLRGADSAHHWHGRTYIFPVVTSLISLEYLEPLQKLYKNLPKSRVKRWIFDEH